MKTKMMMMMILIYPYITVLRMKQLQYQAIKGIWYYDVTRDIQYILLLVTSLYPFIHYPYTVPVVLINGIIFVSKRQDECNTEIHLGKKDLIILQTIFSLNHSCSADLLIKHLNGMKVTESISVLRFCDNQYCYMYRY